MIDDVLFIDDLAKDLRCSRRTIERRLRAGADLPQQMRRIDSQHRWLRSTVDEWKRSAPAATPLRAMRGGRPRRARVPGPEVRAQPGEEYPVYPEYWDDDDEDETPVHPPKGHGDSWKGWR